MKFSLLNLALVSATLANPIVPHDSNDHASQVISDIQQIQSRVLTLDQTLNSFHTDDPLGPVKTFQFQHQSNEISDAISQTTTTTKSSSKWDSDESYGVARAVAELDPMVKSLLSNIVAHKPAFATVAVVGDISHTVEQSLITQRERTRELGDAASSKLAEHYSGYAPFVTNRFLGYFDHAIEKYHSCSGVFCLPTLPGMNNR